MKYCPFCMSPLNDNDAFCSKCGKPSHYEVPAHHLLPGTVLNRKYTVGVSLGEGGFGITYIGKDNLLDMRVAIKEYFPNGYVSRSNTITADVSTSSTEQRKEFFDKGRERFLKEAQILAKFSGEAGVVNVRDFFEANNTTYIVMEYLDGETLKSHIKHVGTLAPETALSLLMPVMNSLKKVHKMGLIHRDISPDNIMLVDDGKVKLLDFGAARDVSSIGNKSLSVMLKPGYAPEEQYRSKGNQGSWTDVYALSATLYKCITGVTPDDSTQRVFSDEVKKPSELGIRISPVFERALMKGLAVLQKDRYQTIDELLDGLAGKDSVGAVSDDDEKTIGIGSDLPGEEEEKTVGFANEIPVYHTPAKPAAEPETEIPVYHQQASQNEAPRYQQPPQNEAPRYQQPPQNETPRYQQPPQNEAPRYQQPPQNETPRYQQPPQNEAPRYQQPPQNETPRYQQPSQNGAPRYQQTPQNGAPRYQQTPYQAGPQTAPIPEAPVFAQGPTKVGVKNKKSGKKTVLIIVTILVGLALLGGIIAAVSGGGGSSDPLVGTWTTYQDGYFMDWTFRSGKVTIVFMDVTVGNGTYRVISNSQIEVNLTIDGETTAEVLSYQVNGDTLYLDGFTFTRK